MYQMVIENKANNMHTFSCLVPAIWPSALQTPNVIMHLYCYDIGIDTLDKWDYSIDSSVGSRISFFEWEQYLTNILITPILVFYCLTVSHTNLICWKNDPQPSSRASGARECRHRAAGSLTEDSLSLQCDGRVASISLWVFLWFWVFLGWLRHVKSLQRWTEAWNPRLIDFFKAKRASLSGG